MNDQAPVSTIHLMDNQSQLAEIFTWQTSFDPKHTQWRGELRFRTESPDAPFGFTIHFTAATQDQVLHQLTKNYKQLVQFMEDHYGDRLARLSSHIEAVGNAVITKPFEPASFYKRITTRFLRESWVGELEMGNPPTVVRYSSDSQDDILKQANQCYLDVMAYMNNRFTQRLERLSRYLDDTSLKTFIAWRSN